MRSPYPQAEARQHGIIFTQDQLDRLVLHFQEVLDLAGWTIDARLVDHEGMASSSDEVAVGWVHAWWEFKSARIHLLRHEDWRRDTSSHPHLYDHLCFLIHEMLHIVFWPHRTGDESHGGMLMEQGLNDISRALAEQYRQILATEDPFKDE